MKHRIKIAAALAVSGMAAAASPAFAVSYASGVRNTGGSSWEFILNEPAAAVTITRNGGNPLTLNALTAGRHTFDMTGFNNFEIKVETTAAAGWTPISDATNMFTHYERPNGVVVNNIPGSPYFGTVYVSNGRSTTAGGGAGRVMGDGVYALTADRIGVDLTTRAAIATASDNSLAKAPGWNVTESGTNGNSVFRLSMDDGGNIIAGDWSDINGGIKYASPDLTTGGSLLLHQDGTVVNKTTPPNATWPDGLGLLTNSNGQEVHGSIASRPYVTGTLGQDLAVYAIDEDLSPKGVASQLDTHGNSLWKWNVGAVVGNFDQAPQLVIDASAIPRTSVLPGQTAGGQENFMSIDVGVLADAVYSPATNKWYLTQNRADGNQGGLVVITPDGVNGATPTLSWSSYQFTIDNALDGHATVTGVQDIFRNVRGVELSPDGKTLFISRAGNTSAVLSTANGAGGSILAIPLDAQGVPTIGVDAGKVTGITSIDTLSNAGGHASGSMAFDAAGNLYFASNVSERLQVFSPGGNWVATTTSAGGFTVAAAGGGGLPGDFNGDNAVDGSDFLAWQRGQSPGNGSAADLATWKANFGNTAPASGAVGAVPEPSAGLLAMGAVAALGFLKRRRS